MIDWTAHDVYPPMICECLCGCSYLSHARFVIEPAPGLRSRRPCPTCGRDDALRAARSAAPEVTTIGGRS